MKESGKADSALKLYQRFTLALLFPPLMSFFSGVVALFNTDYAQGLALNAMVYSGDQIKNRSGYIAFVLVVGLALVGLGVLLTLRAAKGKLYAVILGLAAYLADFIFGFIVYSSSFGNAFIIRIICHGIFLILMGAALFFYFFASKRLKEEKMPPKN
ncbi:MAG: hypothetical protein BWY98_01330 [Tenericutes bacterium ADurb.BinA155]|nr:MAG: hypothetical protein BWY98_01330 [Tenericutes bacterium ADurb.BinA155]